MFSIFSRVFRLSTDCRLNSSLSALRVKKLSQQTKNIKETTAIVKISDNCVQRLKEIKNEKNKYLKISVDSGGCSGFEYKFSLEDKLSETDLFVERDNCRVIIDKDTIDYLKGSTIDYHEELIKAGFRVIGNPNAEHGCSCGSSFSVKI